MSFYKVYYTDMPLPAGVQPDLSLVIPLEFASRDDALGKAFKLIFEGAVVWKIEGPAGFKLQREEIETQFQLFRTK